MVETKVKGKTMSLLGVCRTVLLLVLVTAILWSWVGFVSERRHGGFDPRAVHASVEEVSELRALSGGDTVEDEGPGSEGFDPTAFPLESFFEGLEGFIPG